MSDTNRQSIKSNTVTESRARLSLAAKSLRQDGVVVIIDDLQDAGTHHLGFNAADATVEKVCFLVNHSRGVLVAAMWEQDLRALQLTPMSSPRGAGLLTASKNLNAGTSRTAPDMMISIDARHDTTTGISAHDRATTLRLLPITEDMQLDFVMPGHIFPLRAKNGGVLVRATIAEVSLDLLGTDNTADNVAPNLQRPNLHRPVIALGQILNELGSCASTSEALELAGTHSLPVVYFSDVIKERLSSTSLMDKIAESKLPVRGVGEFRAIAFRSRSDEAEHVALVMGDISDGEPVLVRVHAEHRLADTLGLGNAQRSIYGALKRIAAEKRGVFVYLRHPRKGFLRDQVQSLNKLESPQTAMNLREHGVGVQILRALGVNKIKLLTNAQRDVPGLSAFDLEIVERVGFSVSEKSPLHSIPAIVQPNQ